MTDPHTEAASASITIHHNPDGGTSRNTPALIRNSGVEPVIVEYLVTPPGRTKPVELIEALGVPVRAVPRSEGTLCDGLKLGDRGLSVDKKGHRVAP